MLAAADLDLPEEFAGPVAYSDRWLWLALAGLLLVVLYYVAVLLLTRPRPVGDVPDAPPDARSRHLARIDAVEQDVRAGRISHRAGHQRLSEAVRSYVEAVSTIPATTMGLADFRMVAPAPLTDAIELMYPPEFAPEDDGVAAARFAEAVRRSRDLVASWG